MTEALAGMGARPNQVSASGLVFALLAGASFGAVAVTEGGLRASLLLVAPILIGLRLLANMLDGLLAVEAGKGTPDGPLWNELPDRIADVAVIVGAGYGTGAPELGWAAACAAVSTAYVRAVSDALGAPGGFSGPMAKPQRMAVLGFASAVAALLGLWVLEAGIWIVLVGSVLTAGLRIGRLRRALLGRGR